MFDFSWLLRKLDRRPMFKFDEGSLTPRKREILTWLRRKKIELRAQDSNNPSNMDDLRVYIPLALSRSNMDPFLVLTPVLSDPLLELFDYEFALEYVDSYPNADKFRYVPKDGTK